MIDEREDEFKATDRESTLGAIPFWRLSLEEQHEELAAIAFDPVRDDPHRIREACRNC